MNRSVLAIGAHPDDIEIGCGGTLLMLSKKGYAIDLVLATSGEQGAQADKEETRSLREFEARAAGRALGARSVEFLREPDGLSFYSLSAKLRLIAMIRELKPEMIFTHSRFDLFPDHRVVHQLSLSALKGAAGPWFAEAGGGPHSVRACYGYEVWNPIPEPQMFNDISSVIDKKVEALNLHQSQVKSIDYAAAARGLARYRGVLSQVGAFAEAFEIMKMDGPL